MPGISSLDKMSQNTQTIWNFGLALTEIIFTLLSYLYFVMDTLSAHIDLYCHWMSDYNFRLCISTYVHMHGL